LAGVPAKPREPAGVAELFRHCLDAAHAFRARQRRSSRLLLWTAGGAGVVVAGMVALAAALLSGVGHNERQLSNLESRVESYRTTEGQSSAERLRGDPRSLEERIAVVEELKRDPEFKTFPQESPG